ncbi:hypothetical protein BMS3Abin07_00510 [bacterium BMS3Abin07]|nr:hypothetical protein BMS3Abin07_00510 [bacterium BMS3Abin07]GBE31114.1 hypothetical protein BMS3Bbin05_00010 [bacterium BMS3Bbin05]HDL20988.1 hypothetical protein [Nitrospirota bacterium]HDO22885.1 hypothetical protein [Nitrospirota bacterium]HDZ87213.1 hypothetical protein [Nitrospirota bacterium]
MSDLVDLLLGSTTRRLTISILLAVIITTAITFILLKFKKGRKTIEERLFDISRARDCSEYDLFMEAAGMWNIPEAQVQEDFKRYLLGSEIPHYIRSYLRAEEKKDELNGLFRMWPGGI